jgi:hypothetical protein
VGFGRGDLGASLQATWEFEGKIIVLHHPTTINTNYQAMVSDLSVRCANQWEPPTSIPTSHLHFQLFYAAQSFFPTSTGDSES